MNEFDPFNLSIKEITFPLLVEIKIKTRHKKMPVNYEHVLVTYNSKE